jgi:hypothetical protein
MSFEDRFYATFAAIRASVRTTARKQVIDDIQGQMEDDADLQDILRYGRHMQEVAVTFDRRPNSPFSYPFADSLLRILDAHSGGSGIYKPCNQLRVMRWRGTCDQLVAALLRYSKANSQFRLRRVLVLPYSKPAGHRLDVRVHRA